MFFIAHLALSLQRRLLDRILSEIRAIGISHTNDMILICCTVDGKPSELLVDEMECAATEVIPDFPDDGYGIKTHVERVDSPSRYDKADLKVMRWICSRYEQG